MEGKVIAVIDGGVVKNINRDGGVRMGMGHDAVEDEKGDERT